MAKSKPMTVSIPKPCDQNWTTFKPTSNGGFCSSCKKEVIDFTRWKPEEIRAYFSRRPNGACGKFRPSQLRDYPSDRLNVGSAMKWIAPTLITASLNLPPTESAAQKVETFIAFNDSQSNQKETATEKSLVVPKEIKGKVLDDMQVPFPGVNVMLNGTTTGTVTNEHGEFNLTINESSGKDTLVFSFIGYLDERISIGQKEHVEVIMRPDEAALSEVVIMGGVCAYRWYSPRGMWYKIKGLFRRN